MEAPGTLPQPRPGDRTSSPPGPDKRHSAIRSEGWPLWRSTCFRPRSIGITAKAVAKAALSATEAQRLQTSEHETAFKISYVFYDYKDQPIGSGWFLTPKKYITLTTKIGLWDQ